MTGVCVHTTMTCEVLAWCPIENDHSIPEYVPTLSNSDALLEIAPVCPHQPGSILLSCVLTSV